MKILDACCGSRMFWYDKNNEYTTYMDNRTLQTELCDGRTLEINPDLIADFTNMPFKDNEFDLVVFDPLHLVQGGDKSWLVQKYGRLEKDTWREDLNKGFKECMRVLKPTGTMVFKWNETQVKLGEVLKAIDYKPILGNKTSKNTHWLVFVKGNDNGN